MTSHVPRLGPISNQSPHHFSPDNSISPHLDELPRNGCTSMALDVIEYPADRLFTAHTQEPTGPPQSASSAITSLPSASSTNRGTVQPLYRFEGLI
ncbi:hypothetical protein CC2G_009502 [Coprinopsis cinerea AmutBmut pab1-1]|nr:hypothetical protein CC2G_004873 [Coprinopsis cinerea AmutBmut pab1-1]KAG2016326.1 hypothetical protein CC2G_009502 [Coprinopsis cinerea AmutBmut pab1-1]